MKKVVLFVSTSAALSLLTGCSTQKPHDQCSCVQHQVAPLRAVARLDLKSRAVAERLPIDQKLFDRADIVIRANLAYSARAGSHYISSMVTNLKTLKAPAGLSVPSELMIAFDSSGPELPEDGIATLYLVHCSRSECESGWKLLQEIDPKTGQMQKGYSHYQKE